MLSTAFAENANAVVIADLYAAGEDLAGRPRGRGNRAEFATPSFVIYAFTIRLPTLYVQVGGLPATESLLLTAINGSIHALSGFLLAAAGALIGVLFAGAFGVTVDAPAT